MLLAQLRRKVPNEFEGMEDVLTSSVFGTLNYLPDSIACDLLNKLGGFGALFPLQGSLEVELWPRYSGSVDVTSDDLGDSEEEDADAPGGTEPDARITAPNWLILIEVKYRSQLDAAYDQLAREFVAGYQHAKQEGRRFRLLVVTAHTLQPTPGGVELETGLREALKATSFLSDDYKAEVLAAVSESLYWTSWQRLYSIWQEFEGRKDMLAEMRRLLDDVCKLLEMRGLKPYDSKPVAKALEQWKEAAIPDGVWSIPVRYHYRTVYSVAMGWERLHGLDMGSLSGLARLFRAYAQRYALSEQLESFQLGTLARIHWKPYH